MFFLCCLFLFLLATAKGRVADGIPIPSSRPSVVDCFVCIFCLAHCCGQRKFTVSNDTSRVEVFSLFQLGFNCRPGFAFLPCAAQGELLFVRINFGFFAWPVKRFSSVFRGCDLRWAAPLGRCVAPTLALLAIGAARRRAIPVAQKLDSAALISLVSFEWHQSARRKRPAR